VREASEEVERMSRLAADLLFLAAAEADEVVGLEPVRLDEVVAGVWERARHADGGVHEVRLGGVEPLTVLADRIRLEQLVWNLVENGLRYTPPGGSVDIELSRSAGMSLLRVSDTGVGIAEEHLTRIFERFYRVDQARSRGNGGTGLGLAIVQSILQAHGGNIKVSSQVSRGTVFTVSLPVHSTPSDVPPEPPSEPVIAAVTHRTSSDEG
jgi:signal transduction histidine kinase